jgi:hypothetical protein
MTLHPQQEFAIPEETARVARAVYPKGNLYMKVRDALGTIYQDESFAPLFPQNGRPVEAPWRLAFITVVQFLEELPDRQAADAVRGRIESRVCLRLKTGRSRLRLYYSFGLSRPPGAGGSRADAFGCHAGSVQGTRMAQTTATATHRLHPHSGQDPCYQSADLCG